MFIAGFPAGSLQANCYLVALGPGEPCLIIDPGEDAVDGIDALVVEHGLQPVGALLTHGHLDHAASLQQVSRLFKIPGFVHEADDYMLDDPMAALSPELRSMLAGRPMPMMRPDPLVYLDDDGELEFGELRLKVEHTPGHTGGSVVFRLAGDGTRPDVLFTGDTLFAGSVGRTDLPGGSTAVLNDSLLRLARDHRDEAVILPGHGPRSTIGAEKSVNPFVAPLVRAAENAAENDRNASA